MKSRFLLFFLLFAVSPLFSLPSFGVVGDKLSGELVLTLFVGCLIGLFLYNLMLYFSTKAKVYLFYSVYLFFFFLSIVSINDYNSILSQKYSAYVSSIGPLSLIGFHTSLVLFSAHILGIRKLSPKLFKMTIIVCLGLSPLLLAFFLENNWRIVGYVAALLFFLYCVYLAVFVWKQNPFIAKIYVLAISGHVVGVSIFLASLFGVLSFSAEYLYAVYIGSIWEVILLSFILAHNIRALKEELDSAVIKNDTDSKMLFLQSRYVAMGETIGNIAHQWKQPLNAIATIQSGIKAALIYQGEISKDKLLKSVDTSFEILQHLGETVDTFYSFLSQKNNHTTYFVVSDELNIIRKITSYSFENSNIKLTFELNANPKIYGNPNEFVHALLNLILNAKDALDDSKIDSPHINVRIDEMDDKCVICVSDNAGGIKVEPIDRIFDLSVSTKDDSIGIGLCMTKNIIENRFNGTIQAGNRDDGAFFTIEIPYCSNEHINAISNLDGMGHIRQLTAKIIELEGLEKTLKKVALNNIHDAVYLIDTNGRFSYVNTAACFSLGYSEDELLRMGIGDIDPYWPMERWGDFWERIKQAKSVVAETQHRRRDGTVFQIEVSAHYFEYEGVGYNLAICRDITERKQLEEQKDNERTRLFFERQVIGMSITSPEKGWLKTNKKVHDMLGYSHEELSVMTWAEVTHPDDLAEDVRLFEMMLRGEIDDYIIEKRYIRKDGAVVYANLGVSCVRNDDGSVNYVLALLEDISERKRIESELQELNATLDIRAKMRTLELQKALEFSEGVINAIPDLLFELDKNGKYLNVWAQNHDLLAAQKDVLLGNSVYDVLSKEAADTVMESLAEAQVDNISFGKTIMIDLPQGRSWFELSVSKKQSSNGSDNTFMLLSRDITERKKMENELEEAARSVIAASRAKSEFLANMSHEIRTPLNAIVGMAHLLGHEELDEKQSRYASNIITASSTLLNLINSILDFSKIEAGKMELFYDKFNLYDLILELESNFTSRTQEKEVGFVFNIDDNVPSYVIGDFVKVRQIMTNLIGNAIKFTDKGSVTVSATVVEEGDDAVSIELGVRDTGIGMTDEQRNRVFDEFYQVDSSNTKIYGGTGLGLAISKRLSELMGGSVGLSSEIGKGSYFFVRIPFVPSYDLAKIGKSYVDGTKKHDTTKLGVKFLDGKKILVVDDNDINRETLTSILKHFGAQVVEAANGEEAVIKMTDSDLAIDAILMDIQMPVMDGFEASRKIRNLGFKELPIVALSADVTQASIGKASNSGMNEYLTKPIDMDELAVALAKYFGDDFDISSKTSSATSIKTIFSCIDTNRAMSVATGDMAAFNDLLLKLFTNMKDSYALLTDSIVNVDMESAKRIARFMNGRASNLGIACVAKASLEMEVALNSNRTESVQECIVSLGRALDDFEKQLALMLPEIEMKREG